MDLPQIMVAKGSPVLSTRSRRFSVAPRRSVIMSASTAVFLPRKNSVAATRNSCSTLGEETRRFTFSGAAGFAAAATATSTGSIMYPGLWCSTASRSTRSMSLAAVAGCSTAVAAETSAAMRTKCWKSPSPRVWCMRRCAFWAASEGAPTMWMTGTFSAYEPAVALIADSSPTP